MKKTLLFLTCIIVLMTGCRETEKDVFYKHFRNDELGIEKDKDL